MLFLKPLAMATTYLEGDKYPTAACVIPSILSLQEHFTTTKEKGPMLKSLCDLGLFEMKKKFEHFMDVTHPQFDQTYLMCSLLHQSKSLELNGELAPNPNNQPQSTKAKANILFLQLIYTFFNCLVFFYF